MSSSFTDGATVVQPFLVLPGEFARASQHVLNQVVSGTVDVVLRPAAPRAGTLTAIFTTLADAVAFETMLAAVKVITFADSDVPAFGMNFVATDRIQIARAAEDPVTLGDGSQAIVYSIIFGFQQVK